MQKNFGFSRLNSLQFFSLFDSRGGLRRSLLWLFLPFFLFLGCQNDNAQKNDSPFSAVDPQKLISQEIVKGEEPQGDEVTLSIAVTSDLHGHLYDFDYALGVEDKKSGLTKISTLVKELRAEDPDLFLMDLGDTIQDNSAELFNADPVHPMIRGLNLLNYDLWTLGNHEFNFEPDFLIRNINGFDGTVATSNILFTETGEPFLLTSQIFVIKGVRTAVINAITPHIPRWEASTPEHFAGLTFADPAESVKGVVESLEGEYDLLIGGFHIGLGGEYGSTGVTGILEAVPEFDVIFHGHEHARRNEVINGIPVIEPGAYGWALAHAEVSLKREGDGWVVESVETENLETENVVPDAELVELFKPEHEKALADANLVIGKVSATFIERPDYITGEDEITTMPTSQLEDNAIIDLINTVQMTYANAEISSAAIFNFGSNLKAGDFRKKDVAFIYRYPNTLNGVSITGENLLKYMEWSASYYNTYQPGDLTISFNPEIRGYNYDMFSGVEYEIDISQPAGSRIQNVSFQGEPIDLEREYKLALNNYRLGTLLSLELVTNEDIYYDSYEEKQDKGRIRDLIVDYVQNVAKGEILPNVDNNWRVVGTEIDPEKEEILFEKVRAGEIVIPRSEDGRTPNVRSLREDEI